MNALFKGSNLTDFSCQKGCDVTIESCEGKLTVFSVWCDAIEPAERTVRVRQNDERELLIVTVDKLDYKVPSVTYSDNKSYCYITFNSVSVHLNLDDEGVVVDVWDSPDAIAVVDTTYLFYNELDAKQ